MTAQHYKVSSRSPQFETTAFDPNRYSTGVFTTFLNRRNEPVFRLTEHFKRLESSCRFLSIPFPWARYEAFDAMLQDYRRDYAPHNELLRMTIVPDQILISRRPCRPLASIINACTVSFDRPFPTHKHISLLHSQYYPAGFDVSPAKDFIRVSSQGFLTETAYANIFVLTRNDRLLTPHPQQSGCLPGIMRQAVIDVATAAGLPVEEGVFPESILAEAKGVFLSNAARGLYPLHRINETVFEIEASQTIYQMLMKDLPFHNTTLPSYSSHPASG